MIKIKKPTGGADKTTHPVGNRGFEILKNMYLQKVPT